MTKANLTDQTAPLGLLTLRAGDQLYALRFNRCEPFPAHAMLDCWRREGILGSCEFGVLVAMVDQLATCGEETP